ncbi:hypothetical protein [Caulobacter sp. NIBR1757]|uniref:hypothetical protein n=1 Tax=Caulobacter sp. NIBR1757 TaxID=3016000 RepID=UPI0022F0866B|nr:hypothetical protein [Caulobacter sp. NIBR1757]WGM40633.1 hypothetical protein AMEJIAPC_03580 [Caulobacter sp. NIBR1757]
MNHGYSESAMVMWVAADSTAALTLRFCRFPDDGVTWLWCHVLEGDRLFGYTDHGLACDDTRAFAGSTALYRTAAPSAWIRRSGSDGAMTEARFAADLSMIEGHEGRHGPGDIGVTLTGLFTPRYSLGEEVAAGRREVVGDLAGEIVIDGRRISLDGPAKYHEQRQETPRFTEPFRYLCLWGPSASCVAIASRAGQIGAAMQDGVESIITRFEAPPIADARSLVLGLRDGTALAADVRTLKAITLPIGDEIWRGSFVTATLGAHSLTGMLNEWRADQLPPPAS